MKPEPLILTASTILTAQRLARLLTVNALGLAVINDDRAPVIRAGQDAPNKRPRTPGGVTMHDYTLAARKERAAAWDVLDAERFQPDRLPRLAAAHHAARKEREEVEAALRDSLMPRAPAGHATAYAFKVPAAEFHHPQFGAHARTSEKRVTVDTASLTGDDLAAFLAFYRAPFQVGTRWPLYAPCKRDGLRPARNHPATDAARVVFERLILQHPGSVPDVHAIEAEQMERQTA